MLMPIDPLAKPRNIRRTALLIAAGILALIIGAVGTWLVLKLVFPPEVPKNSQTNTSSPSPQPSQKTEIAAGQQLDITKNYGNKYANGLLPVGDSKYSTTEAKKGSVYACSQYAQSFATDKGGAGTRGPWFVNNNTQYDINKKSRVSGNVSWKGSFTNVVANDKRTITTNDLPLSHATGTFPIASSDPAYSYDRNPNTISAQSLSYNLNGSPTYGAPQCIGGEVGIMLTGVSLFSAFDAGGRDAGAWEVQDDCAGHPQVSGQYHYHTLSSCIKDVSVHTIIGFALDGYPITGPQVGPNNILTTDDLDECHGTISQITLDGKSVTGYHYVMTQDFPYSVSCFRSTAVQPPMPQQQPGTQQQPPTQQQPQSTQPPQQAFQTPPLH